jgi:hypothetical protein
MKVSNVLLFITVIFLFQGCYIGQSKLEVFENFLNINLGKKQKSNNKTIIRKDYDMSKYIYIYSGDSFKNKDFLDKRCVFGYLTEKDDPKQRAIDWKIISGKEYCKQQQKYILSF